MSKCFIITAYCDTQEKEESLKDTIFRIKRFGYDILLYSHYCVNDEIQRLCNYVIYDYSNPIFSYNDGIRAIINWRKVGGIPMKLNSLIDDYGFASIQQIKRSLSFMFSLGYDTSIVLNYDTKFSDEFFIETENMMGKYDALFLDFGDGQQKAFYLAYFIIKIEKFIDTINQISREDYLKNSQDLMVEGYLAKLMEGNVNVINRIEWENKGKVWTDIIFTKDLFNRENAKCNLFLGLEKLWLNNDIIDYDKLAILCYTIKDDFELSVKYDGDLVYFIKVKKDNGYYYSHLPISFSNLDYTKIKIFVDNIDVYSEYKKSINSSAIEILTTV